MSTPLVVSVTDELVAELETLANECGHHGANWYEPRHMAAFPEYSCDQDFVVAASPATILAFLAERAELKRDAARYRWLQKASPYMHKKIRDLAITDGGDVFYFHKDKYDTAIDAAMQSEAKQ